MNMNNNNRLSLLQYIEPLSNLLLIFNILSPMNMNNNNNNRLPLLQYIEPLSKLLLFFYILSPTNMVLQR